MQKPTKRKSPLACRPDPQHQWLYAKINSEKRKLKVKTKQDVIQHILVQYFTEPA